MAVFRFKQFAVRQEQSAMKVGTDSMVLGAIIPTKNHSFALDVGTGTGVLSLMLAQKNPSLRIHAIELDSAACQEAKFNVQESPFSSQIQVFEVDFFSFPFSSKFDLIFSNPPYFNATFLPDNEQRALARHAHFSFESFFQKVAQLLTSNGDLWIILPLETYKEVVSNQLFLPFFLIEEIDVWGNPHKKVRKILRFSFQNQKRLTRNFLIRNESGLYSDEYKKMTADFHAQILK